jgi:multidrug efflux pump subunit AcrA (membrane-fusion protein)
VRIVNGNKQEINVKLGDIVQPGDTIIVRERFF